MTDERQEPTMPPEKPATAGVAGWPVPGLAWAQEALEGAGRAQAAMAAQTLRRLNAPVAESLERHRELAATLAASARQMAEVAEQIRRVADQHADLVARLQAGMEPYLRYVDWLDAMGGADRPAAG